MIYQIKLVNISIRIHIAILYLGTTMYNQKTYAIVAIAAVATMLIATSAISVENAFADKKKSEYSQSTSQANACGNGVLSTNVACQNIDSQIQGDENGVAITGQQTFEEEEEIPLTPLVP
jgi:hypothetical protein